MKHLDIGTIHAFLDGELSGDELEYAASHFTVCERCSNLMLEAENETDAVMQAFAVENLCSVPTQRIWARINNEIDLLESIPDAAPQPASVWQHLATLFGFKQLSPFAVPSAAFALGVAVVAVFSLYGAINQTDSINNSGQIARNTKPEATVIDLSAAQSATQINDQPARNQDAPVIKAVAPKKRVGDFTAMNASYRIEEKPRFIAPRDRETAKRFDSSAPLVEERFYLDAIADLSNTVQSSDAEAMRPSLRVEYEQNLALVDKAIDKMQKQVRRNPKDENARQILFASYQSKIDLLNTVAEKSQLMATLR